MRKALHIALLAAALLPGAAGAWPFEGDEVHPGVIYRRFSGSIDIPGSGVSTQEIFVLYVDTANPAVSFAASRPGDRGMVTSRFAEVSGAKAAINTNFFGGGYASCGMAMGEGELWTGSYHDIAGSKCSDSVGVTRLNDVSFFDSWDTLNGPAPAGVADIVTGMPTIVRGGVIGDEAALNSGEYPSHMATANPRTGVCMHEDGTTFVMIIVDGRSSGRTGMRIITFARFMKHILGCRDGVNLDGGGSSTMYVEGQPGFEGRPDGIVNKTSDGHERTVCCNLGVRVDPEAKWYAAELTDQAADPAVGAGEVFELWAKYRNTGRRPWPSEGAGRVLLGTDDPRDRESPFYLSGDWVSPARAAAVGAPVAPGEEGTFTFGAAAPAAGGDFVEAFTPVVEGGPWMDPAVVEWGIAVADPEPDGDEEVAEEADEGAEEGRDGGDGDAAQEPGLDAVPDADDFFLEGGCACTIVG